MVELVSYLEGKLIFTFGELFGISGDMAVTSLQCLSLRGKPGSQCVSCIFRQDGHQFGNDVSVQLVLSLLVTTQQGLLYPTLVWVRGCICMSSYEDI